MNWPLRKRSFAARFAVWVWVLAALLPGARQALAGLQGPGLAFEVCSSTGVVGLPNDDGPAADMGAMDCAWCLVAHHSALPPPTGFAPLPLVSQRFLLPTAGLAWVYAFTGHAVQPRAPPILS
jgi:Protein of unknown function (DUF2946)